MIAIKMLSLWIISFLLIVIENSEAQFFRPGYEPQSGKFVRNFNSVDFELINDDFSKNKLSTHS